MVTRIAMSDPVDFEQLYREQVPFVLAAARAFGVAPAMLDDVAQDVFVTVYRKLSALNPNVSPRPFLYVITRRTAFRYRRTAVRSLRKREAARSLAADPIDADEDAPRWLRHFLSALEPEQRETFVLAELLGMSGPEIADVQRVPLNTAYSRLRLARRRLRDLVRSPDHARVLLDASRERAPSEERRARIWAAMAPSLSAAARQASVTATAGGVRMLAGLAAGAIAAVSALIVADRLLPPARAAEPAAVRTVAEPHAEASPGLRRRSDPATPEQDASVVRAEAGPTPATLEPPRPRTTTSPRKPEQRADDEDALAAELALIRAAERELASGDAEAALQQLEQHGQRFPRGQLADVRDVHRVAALRALGRDEQAAQAARAARCAHPESNVLRAMPGAAANDGPCP